MCAIAGIRGQNISSDLKKMLDTLQHRGRDDSGYWIDGSLFWGDLCKLNLNGASLGLGHKLLSIVGRESSQPLLDKEMVLVCNGEIYNYQELKSKYDLKFKTESDCEVILRLIRKFQDKNLLESLKKILPLLDGDYAFALFDGDNLALARDPVGVKPLYYGEIPGKVWAFSSERKALWKLGIKEVQNLPPGHVLFNKELILVLKIFEGVDSAVTKNREKPKSALKSSLIRAVEKRVQGLEEVGLVFSGGVDSSLLAYILKGMGVNTTLYTVGTSQSSDMSYAQKVADDLGFKLRSWEVDEELVKISLKPVLTAIEEFNIMKIGVGMPLYLASKMAREDGLKVMLSGQGADELMGGYHRYLQSLRGNRDQEFLKEDIEKIYEVNLERDDKVTMSQGVELRVPYLDRQVIKIAMQIPLEYKIEHEKDSLRKHILREVALEVGVPEYIAYRPKKAAQYGSGIDKILRKKALKKFQGESFMKNLRGF